MRGKPQVLKVSKCIIAFLAPLIICLMYMLIRGSFALYLPDSYNNDALFYYKLVEGIVKGGSLKGYFGFNESSALIGGFAAWNPAVVMPWVLFGFIFRWNYFSVFFCNILFLSAAFAAFTWLSDISIKKLVCLIGLFMLFPAFPVHALNMLPEAVVCSFVILYLGFAIKACENPRIFCIIGMLVCCFYLTLCRPYMIVFYAVPVYFWIKRGKVSDGSEGKGRRRFFVPVIISAAVILSSVAVYYLTNKFFTAAYFEPLFNLDIVDFFIHGNIREAVRVGLSMNRRMLTGIGGYIGEAFSYGLTAGTQYAISIVCTIISIVLLFDEKNKKYRPVFFIYALTSILLYGSIVLFLQKVNEGGRHVFFLAVMGIFVLSLAELEAPAGDSSKPASKVDVLGIIVRVVPAILLIIFIIGGSFWPTDYDAPFRNDATVERVSRWKEIFKKENVAPTGEISYDNTVIWVLYDLDEDGDMYITDYHSLYALPAGMGICCCMPDYVYGNIEGLKSRYVATDSRGKLAEILKEKGYEVVGEIDDLVVFRLYETD